MYRPCFHVADLPGTLHACSGHEPLPLRLLQRSVARVPLHAFTLRDAIYSWAPPTDGNDSARYLADVVAGFGGVVDADTPLSEVLEIAA